MPARMSSPVARSVAISGARSGLTPTIAAGDAATCGRDLGGVGAVRDHVHGHAAPLQELDSGCEELRRIRDHDPLLDGVRHADSHSCFCTWCS